jgi:hypothetical protein
MLLGAYRFHQYKGVQHVKMCLDLSLSRFELWRKIKSAAQYKEEVSVDVPLLSGARA